MLTLDSFLGARLKRSEVIDLLKEISEKCGDGLIVDSVSLVRRKQPIEPFSDPPEPKFKLYMQTSLDNVCKATIREILEQKQLAMTETDHFLIIFRP